METLLQDIRYAGRTLVKSPGFAALTILCLALGIGVDSTIFSVVDAIAIRPLPFRDPDRLQDIGMSRLATARDVGGVSFLDFQELRAHTTSFSAFACDTGRNGVISDVDEPERLREFLVSANLFPTLGIDPVVGRQFRDDEDRPGAPPVVLLSYGLWQRRYAGDPTIVGRTITLDTLPTTVVGVMPPRFQFPENADLWIPVSPRVQGEHRDNRDLDVLGRLEPGVSAAVAREELAALGRRLAASYREDNGQFLLAQSMRDALIPDDVRLIVFTMLGAVTCVLLIACGNVANLLLARATVRQREIAIRAAIGAGRTRIVRQMLTESVLIALASAPLGVALAYIGLRWLSAAIPPGQLPYYINWDLDGRVVAYTAVVAGLTGLVFGLAPTAQAVRRDLFDSLKDAARGSTEGGRRGRLRNILVIGEIALAVVVLVMASLFVRTFHNFETARAGVPTRGLLTLRVFLTGDRYEAPEAQYLRAQDLVQRVEAIPGVVAATASQMSPFGTGGDGGPVVAEGVAYEKGKEPGTAFFGVTPHLLKTINQPLIAGRDFTDAEGAGKSHVAIVNQVFARQMWPQLAAPLGRRFRFATDPTNDWITVIGVVGDFRLFTVRDGKPAPYAFLSYLYNPTRNNGLTIRVAGASLGTVMQAVRARIKAADPTIAIFNPRTGDQARADTYWEYRIYSWMFGIFGVVALLLAAIGVYGMLAYSVTQRTQEIGVRVALGASRQSVFRLVLASAGRLAVPGIAIGVGGGLVAAPVVRSLLYNVSPMDPITFVGVSVFLLVVALAASYVPARRAMAVDPMVALRAE